MNYKNVPQYKLVEMASAIVERQWDKENYPVPHTYQAENGDFQYREEVQDEFLEVLDILDEIANPPIEESTI
jgi:hypothetical protein